MADDVLFATRQAASGFSGVGTIKADLLDDARIHCQKSSEKLRLFGSGIMRGRSLWAIFLALKLSFAANDPHPNRHSASVCGACLS